MNKPCRVLIFIGCWVQDSCHKTLKSAKHRKLQLEIEGPNEANLAQSDQKFYNGQWIKIEVLR